eukprot:6089923-Amphidinium_carterae.1
MQIKAQKRQRTAAAAATRDSGLSSSIAFTPVQGGRMVKSDPRIAEELIQKVSLVCIPAHPGGSMSIPLLSAPSMQDL